MFLQPVHLGEPLRVSTFPVGASAHGLTGAPSHPYSFGSETALGCDLEQVT